MILEKKHLIHSKLNLHHFNDKAFTGTCILFSFQTPFPFFSLYQTNSIISDTFQHRIINLRFCNKEYDDGHNNTWNA